MQHLEFTIEPFVDGEPGPHVTEPQRVLRELGVNVEVGPFGTSADVDDDTVGNAVAALVQAAIAHGASHVHLDISAADEAGAS